MLLTRKSTGRFFGKNNLVKMLELLFSSKLDWGSYIVYIAKIPSKTIGPLIHSMKFISPEVALFFYKCSIQPYMEYCCHVCSVDKIQKKIAVQAINNFFHFINSNVATFLERMAFSKPIIPSEASVSFKLICPYRKSCIRSAC